MEAVAVGSTVASGVMAMKAGADQVRAGKIQRDQYEQEAQAAQLDGAVDAADAMRDLRRTLGAQQAYFASAGVDPGSATQAIADADTRTADRDRELAKLSLSRQVRKLRTQGAVGMMQARNEANAMYLQGVSKFTSAWGQAATAGG